MPKFDIVIETAKGDSLKYHQDPATGVFELKKALPLGMVFPYDFGFIPGTKGEDGDPLDAMVISEFRSITGCRIQCRLIGGLLAEQSGQGKKIRNDRFFFIPGDSIVFAHVTTMQDFGSQHNEQLRDFFINYNKAEGKIFRPLQMITPATAARMIVKAKKNDV